VADGFFHSFSGWVVYIVAFLLLFAVGRVLDSVGRRGRGSKGSSNKARVVQEEKKAKAVAAAASSTAVIKAAQVKGAEQL
jgi:hypothetical protein